MNDLKMTYDPDNQTLDLGEERIEIADLREQGSSEMTKVLGDLIAARWNATLTIKEVLNGACESGLGDVRDRDLGLCS